MLSGSPATFQKLMYIVLAPVLGDFVLIYLVDVVVDLPSFAEHLQQLSRAFKLFQQVFLVIKLEKCQFRRQKIKYLRFKLTLEGVQIDESKTQVIQGIPHSEIAKKFPDYQA